MKLSTQKTKKLFTRSIDLKDIKQFFDSEGLKIEMFKFAAQAYKTSAHRLSGVSMRFGDLEFSIGPLEGSARLIEPSMRKLILLDHNAAAIYAILIDWTRSKLATKGLVYLCDDVMFRIGPMKNPLMILPERKRAEPNLESE